jgi:hypothetical protein
MSAHTGAFFPQIAPPNPLRPVFDVYVNQVRLGATLSDFTIICGATEDAGFGNIVNQDKVTIRLAPGTAKMLYLNLITAISAYEESVAPIPVPHNLAKTLEDIKERISSNYRQQMESPNLENPTGSEPISAPTAFPPPS